MCTQFSLYILHLIDRSLGVARELPGKLDTLPIGLVLLHNYINVESSPGLSHNMLESIKYGCKFRRFIYKESF